ncbi:MAG TPA: tetratricopeptide repeat protein [Vicinamibacteria bacterium]|nr:tetratricopeptide repeat protein [Vicinamibacteria bacterium]
MSDSALLAVLLAGMAGLLAGRAWAAALRRGERDRAGYRASPHYAQGLQYLAAGHVELAVSELGKVVREDPDAVEVLQVLGSLLREIGQVERAIQTHQGLLARRDLSRAERAHALAALGADFRRAGFLDRASRTFDEALFADPRNIQALIELQKVQEEQRQWTEAYRLRTRLSRLRKSDDSLVLGYLQAEIGREALLAGETEAAQKAFTAALALDRRVFPAHLGLADLLMPRDPAKAAAVLEEAIQVAPERAYLAFDRLSRAYTARGQPARFAELCERIIREDPRDWRARLALAAHLRAQGKDDEAFGLLLRAVEANPQALAAHLESWRAVNRLGVHREAVERYLATAEHSVFYRDPHICTACRYRADDMLWRCPHCHEWNTFVEERVGPAAALS